MMTDDTYLSILIMFVFVNNIYCCCHLVGLRLLAVRVSLKLAFDFRTFFHLFFDTKLLLRRSFGHPGVMKID